MVLPLSSGLKTLSFDIHVEAISWHYKTSMLSMHGVSKPTNQLRNCTLGGAKLFQILLEFPYKKMKIFSEFEARWIGWAGVNICIPVFLDEEIVHQYYNGYCNNILWPLFHYLGLPQEDCLATTRSFQSQFVAYVQANEMFAAVEHNSDMKVGWFLHTPFPSSEIHRTLPSRSKLLHVVLTADLVGDRTCGAHSSSHQCSWRI
ncbi:Alpha,alpha-trehalose-phosphate synthase [UDP-forming] 1 [Camellia lanceoleosa]|uniref:Alpha,alpha-trehalose-phosphate synthase [UDP-forming] 1 n=1 Tax=Camellia lanceoleosa TaxID=1840588 RepID=A0ACC0HBX7_9ERIC|nr:Alpha,alpha-trehalose-phosphate synthase [UDP-forming] 1 [Camellia lanceoleosa]